MQQLVCTRVPAVPVYGNLLLLLASTCTRTQGIPKNPVCGSWLPHLISKQPRLLEP
jgi:hypothetical protein